MGDFDANPFADPFTDKSVTQATSESQKPSIEGFNPFVNKSNTGGNPSAAAVLTSSPPSSSKNKSYDSTSNVSAPPVAAPTPAPTLPGHEELLRRQVELEEKAEQLQRQEQDLKSGVINPRKNNWPPLPSCCPVGSCFYQDFSVDIAHEYRFTVKMLYYLWLYYILISLNNIFVCLAIYIVRQDLAATGTQFGLSLLWFILNSPLALCWYRPAYNAFRSDSSFNFFLFFFVMFFQVCIGIVMTVGIAGSGWAGWIVAISQPFSKSIGVGIYACIQAASYTVMLILSIILLKKVHGIYRSTGASFDKAQKEFASGAMKNPHVQTAATSAVQSSLEGKY